MSGPLILKGFDLEHVRGILEFIHATLNVSIPLLHLSYGLNRLVIVTYPQLIHKYCSRRMTVLIITSTIFIGIALSAFELYERGILDGESIKTLLLNGTHLNRDRYSGLISIGILAGLSLIVLGCLSMLTKKMNDTLTENINFPNSMDEIKYRKRTSSYQNIMTMNVSLFIFTLVSFAISVAVTIFTELHHYYAQQLSENLSLNSIATWVEVGLIILSGLEIVFCPLIFLHFLPSVHQSWKWLSAKTLAIVRRCGDQKQRVTGT